VSITALLARRDAEAANDEVRVSIFIQVTDGDAAEVSNDVAKADDRRRVSKLPVSLVEQK